MAVTNCWHINRGRKLGIVNVREKIKSRMIISDLNLRTGRDCGKPRLCVPVSVSASAPHMEAQAAFAKCVEGGVAGVITSAGGLAFLNLLEAQLHCGRRFYILSFSHPR
jgi:hypothetical protein